MREEFNESHIPLAYLITFRCYGTWLHGDERGAVDRDHNVYGTPFLPRRDKLEEEERRRLKPAPVELDVARRGIVDQAVREVCQHRNWALREYQWVKSFNTKGQRIKGSRSVVVEQR